MVTTKERYNNIKKALNEGMSQLSITKRFNASMTTVNRIKISENYADFIAMSKEGDKQRRLKIKAATKVDNRKKKVPNGRR